MKENTGKRSKAFHASSAYAVSALNLKRGTYSDEEEEGENTQQQLCWIACLLCTLPAHAFDVRATGGNEGTMQKHHHHDGFTIVIMAGPWAMQQHHQ